MAPEPVPREDLIEELRAGYEALGVAPAPRDMRDFGEYSANMYYRRFDTWADALRAADIPVPEDRIAGSGGKV